MRPLHAHSASKPNGTLVNVVRTQRRPHHGHHPFPFFTSSFLRSLASSLKPSYFACSCFPLAFQCHGSQSIVYHRLPSCRNFAHIEAKIERKREKNNKTIPNHNKAKADKRSGYQIYISLITTHSERGRTQNTFTRLCWIERRAQRKNEQTKYM